MTRAEKVARAQKLRAEGLKVREIGERMGGFSTSAVNAWLNDPDRSKEIARKDSYRGRCSGCGGLTGGGRGRQKAPTICKKCFGRRHAERNEKILRLHNEGLPHWLIAEEVGCSHPEVDSMVDRMRRVLGRDVSLHRLGGTAEDRRARRRQIIAWRAEGLTNGQIGGRLGTSAASVSGMFKRCRELGLDVPPAPCQGAEPTASAEHLEELWGEGLTLAQIADFCGYSSASAACTRIRRLRERGHDFPPRAMGRRRVAA